MDLKENKNIDIVNVRHPWERARAFIAWNLLKRRLASRSTDNLAILDVGSGDLYQSLSLTNRSPAIAVTALDTAYSPEVTGILSKHTEGKKVVMLRSLDDIPSGTVFSAVLLMDLLEHIEDDGSFLSELVSKPCVDANTTFLITVPAWQYLFSSHDRYLSHYRRYNRRQLLQTCRLAGLVPGKNGYFFLAFWLIRVLQFSINKAVGYTRNEGSDLNPWKEPVWMARIISICLIMDYFICRGFSRVGIHLPGLSAYAVCRKKS